MALNLKKLTSEPAVFLLIFLSLILFRLTFNDELGSKIITIFGYMLVGEAILWKIGQSQIESVSGNSAQALLWAGGSLVALFILYQFVNRFFRQSTLGATDVQLSQSVFQTVYQSMIHFSGTTVDFSQFKYINTYLFGFIVPLVETRTLGRMYGTAASVLDINIRDLKSGKNLALIVAFSLLFMYYHLGVRGVNNNLDLAMTFIFAAISLFLISKFKELESAVELHVGWNALAIFLGR